jgi:urease accessory protein
LGLIIIQSALTVGTALFVRRKGGGVSTLAPRLAGAVIIGVGLATLIVQLVPGP